MARFRDMMALFAMNWIAAEGISSFPGGAAKRWGVSNIPISAIRTAC